MTPTASRAARRAQHLLLVAVAALLLLGGVQASAVRGVDRGHAGSVTAVVARTDVVHQLAPPRAVLVRALRASTTRTTVRWLAILLAALGAAVARRRRSTSDALPFVRTVVSRDLVRRRGPPTFRCC